MFFAQSQFLRVKRALNEDLAEGLSWIGTQSNL